MRIHRLSMTGIGPFKDTQDVDFDRVGSSGLFLLEGPTGAGKSTILDAITFALYGDVAGREADSARMRSHFCGADRKSEVVLEFSSRGNRFRITRTPQYDRAKSRGDGVTRQRATVLLEKSADGVWQSCGSSQAEVAQLVHAELGLNREQFTQVVLLPQGEFAKFLRADDDARRGLLTKLFGAERFDRITDWLKDRARQARDLERDADAELREAVSAMVAAGGIDDSASDEWRELVSPWTPEHGDELASSVRERLGDLGIREQRAATARAEAEQALEDARSAGSAAQQLASLHRDLAELCKELDAHERSRPDHESRTDRKDRAERAMAIETLLDAVADRKASRDSARDRARSHCRDDDELRRHLDDPDAAALAARRYADSAAALVHVAEIEQGLAEQQESLHRLDAEADLQEHKIVHLRRVADELPASIAAASIAVQEARDAAGRLPDFEAALAAAAATLEAAEAVVDLEQSLAAAEEARRIAVDRHQAAVDTHHRLIGERFAGIAAELAAGLSAGEECPVCGSCEHPSPATVGLSSVTPDQVESALAMAKARATERDAASAVCNTLAVRLAAQRSVAGGATVSSARGDRDLAHQRCEQARILGGGLEQASSELETLRQQSTGLGDELEEATTALATLTARADVERTALEAARRKVADVLQGHPSVAARIKSEKNEAIRLEALASATRDLRTADAEWCSAVAAAEREAVAKGFASLEEAQESVMTIAEREALAEGIADWERAGAALLGRRGDARFAGLEAAGLQRAVAESEAAESAIVMARARFNERAAATTEAQRHCAEFGARATGLEGALAARAELFSSHAAIHELDELARGQSRTAHRRMPLTSYVLRLWFDEVVDAANLRLAKIGGGRFELQRTEDASRKTDRVGLGLAIFDRYTGQDRSPNSLSGGETFYTSLALALGLADVVQESAGGVALDTLFIDEGFGSLSGEYLEDVLSVIDGLRDNGRVVGIVSHVEDLKQRIPERLEVRRTSQDGPSSVNVVA